MNTKRTIAGLISFAGAALVIVILLAPPTAHTGVFDTDLHRVSAELVTDGLEHPWAVAFLPDGGYLVTERPGRLRRISADGQLLAQPISGLPRIGAVGQGGLLDVALHPDFTANRWVYLSYSEPGPDGVGTAVARGRLQDMHLADTEVIFRMNTKSNGGRHFGSRLVFDDRGHLFISLGDRGDRPRAQYLDDHVGTLIRLNDDGSVPSDNPFLGIAGALPEIYSYGHRNIQGATRHPVSGRLWTHEHGPQGGDEINLPEPGINHGWPVITYGVNYGLGTSIGEGTAKAGMAQPIHYWTPSIAPSGMAFYNGERFPNWRGHLFVGSLKFRQLVRLELDGERVIAEERMLDSALGRIRDVRQGPDGLLYLLTDDDNGGLFRLVPAD
jgi:glucose/arabinose dehydrogenase